MKRTTLIKRLSAAALAIGLITASMLTAPWDAGSNKALADEQVRSVYTNEMIPAAQASQRPIAIMMPTDKKAQPSYGIGNAKVLYEIMEEGEISRQMAIIDDWRIGSPHRISTTFPAPMNMAPEGTGPGLATFSAPRIGKPPTMHT